MLDRVPRKGDRFQSETSRMEYVIVSEPAPGSLKYLVLRKSGEGAGSSCTWNFNLHPPVKFHDERPQASPWEVGVNEGQLVRVLERGSSASLVLAARDTWTKLVFNELLGPAEVGSLNI